MQILKKRRKLHDLKQFKSNPAERGTGNVPFALRSGCSHFAPDWRSVGDVRPLLEGTGGAGFRGGSVDRSPSFVCSLLRGYGGICALLDVVVTDAASYSLRNGHFYHPLVLLRIINISASHL